jgi:hypothetical protein
MYSPSFFAMRFAEYKRPALIFQKYIEQLYLQAIKSVKPVVAI